MQRVRQFSAQRNDLAKSRLTDSRRNGTFSNMSNSRVEKYQIATPVSHKRESNTPKNLSGSRVSQKSQTSEYICTGCFNHKMASDKKEERRAELLREKQHQRTYTEFNARQDHEKYAKQNKILNQFNEIKEYNKKLIEFKEKEKQKQIQSRNQLFQQQRIQNQLYLSKQKQRKLNEQRANEQLLKDIQQQINFKHKREKQLQDQFKTTQTFEIFGSAEEIYFRQKAKKQQEYRQELIKQIQQRDLELKKEEDFKKHSQATGMGISEAAYQRELERQKKLEERQHSLLEEAKKRKQIKKIQLQKQKQLQKQLQQQRIQYEEDQLHLQQQFSSEKKRQVQNYLKDVEKQIEEQKRKREKQAQEVHKLTKTSIEIVEKMVDRKNCKSCDKKFEKTFLTKIK